MNKPDIGFIGLGIMGRPMAGHILKAGYRLSIYNRSPGRTDELERDGALAVRSPAEVAERSEIIVTMVSDSPDVEAVVAGENGILEAVRPGSIVLDMSTISPEVERRLDTDLRAKGCHLVDAPVSGGDVGAQKATLAIMVGGLPESFERVRPLLETMGRAITYCGPVGHGQLAKLCNQILVSVTVMGVSEALLFARKNGLDPSLMIEAVKDGAAGSWQLSNLGPKIVGRDFRPGFMVDLLQKDLRLVMEAAETSRTPLPAAALVRQLFLSAQSEGNGQEGTQTIGKVLEKLGTFQA